ncbi:MAG TPA: FAD binding domain-containing protein [Candidatus Deferrimicrobiaceae bacterium]|nr:FAD binding domain-containing protein [Candidatus Deferrimicrobiaceae bacterium]
MIPAPFAYERASSVEEALELLRAGDPETRVIAGGQSLLPLMKLRLARPERLIDIGRLEELRGVRRLADGRLAIAALTTYAELLAAPAAMAYALVADALPTIGDVQVRNRGTIGGAVAHADPASDLSAVLLALDTELVVRSAERGERVIAMGDALLGPFTTSLEPAELLVEVRLPGASGAYGSAYRKLAQPASGFAIAGVAAVVGRTGAAADGSFDDVRVAVTGVGERPYRATAVEAALVGTACDPEAVAAAVAHVTDGIDVAGDIHADHEYRAAMAAVMARRAIEAARERLR